MNTFCPVPPGFRFHPTDEELVDYYLRRKVSSRPIDLDVIKDVDLYKIEPWDLQELCRIGSEEQNEWYFFSHKDKKYPTGTRTNRATTAGFWKATGRDKAIYSKHDLVGMRKTLVFYKGRAPNGQKSDWIMHEYRMETEENGAPQEEGWVVCRVFKKRLATVRKFSEHDSPIWYDDHVSFMREMDSPNQTSQNNLVYNHHHHHPYTCCKKEMNNLQQYGGGGGVVQHDHFLQMPFLESPKMLHQQVSQPFGTGLEINHLQGLDHNFSSVARNNAEMCGDRVTDWRVLDKFVASQLSHEEVTKENEQVNLMENTSASASSLQEEGDADICRRLRIDCFEGLIVNNENMT